MKQSVSDALLLVMLFYSKQTERIVENDERRLPACRSRTISKNKVDCLTVAWYLINRNLSMISK